MRRINDSAVRVRVRRTSLARAALAAALLIPGYASNALAAGSISGQITSSVTHSGIAGARVQFYNLTSDDDLPVTATADGSGNYSQNLPDGSYGVLTQNTQGYINKIWNNVACSATCDVNSLTPVVVSGGAVTGINFELDPGGGRIAGTITSSATGNPIAGALVYFLDSGGNVPFSTATTDGAGHYVSDGGTATGSVFVLTQNGQGYQDESYNNHKCSVNSCDAADPVAVTLGATTNGIDFALDLGGRISGTVKDANNSPLANVTVRTYDSMDNEVDEVFTDGSGNFITSGLPTGTYYVRTRNSLGLVNYVWNNLVCSPCNETQGTPISVTVPSTTSGINFVLPPGQKLSGTVTAALGGAPLEGVFVSVVNSSGTPVAGGTSDAAGAFTTGAVPPGTYYANAFSNGYVVQFYNNISCPTGCSFTSGTPIVITNQAVTNIDFSLIAHWDRVDYGNCDRRLQPFPHQRIGTAVFAGRALVGHDDQQGRRLHVRFRGRRLVLRADEGMRRRLLIDGSASINQVYNGVTCVNCQVQTSGGTLVTVANGVATSGIDFTLQRGGVISGTVTAAANGALLSGIGAQIFNSAGVSFGTFNTNVSGVFATAGLPAGTYYVRTSATSPATSTSSGRASRVRRRAAWPRRARPSW